MAIICIHNDNLLIPIHLISIHDFKKHFFFFYELSESLFLFTRDISWTKFGNTDLRKRANMARAVGNWNPTYKLAALEINVDRSRLMPEQSDSLVVITWPQPF